MQDLGSRSKAASLLTYRLLRTVNDSFVKRSFVEMSMAPGSTEIEETSALLPVSVTTDLKMISTNLTNSHLREPSSGPYDELFNLKIDRESGHPGQSRLPPDENFTSANETLERDDSTALTVCIPATTIAPSHGLGAHCSQPRSTPHLSNSQPPRRSSLV